MRYLFGILFSFAMLSSLNTDPQVCAETRLTTPVLIIASLESSLNEVNKQVTAYAETLPAPEKKKLMTLLDRLRKELQILKAKYETKSMLTKQELTRDLTAFSSAGNELRSSLKSAPKNVKLASYSGDPSYCANSCHSMCGSGDAGDQLCFYECYKCCMNGGC